jgi:hypothetical protein
MGLSAQQVMQSDPEFVQRQLQAQEMQRLNPTGSAAGAIGAVLGRGLGNVTQGRGFFEPSNPGLKRVTDVQNIMKSIQFDPNNPSSYYQQVGNALLESGYADLAPMAFVQAQKEEANQAAINFKNAQAERMRNPPAQKPIQIDLGDRIQLRDPETGQVIEEIRKGAAPGQAGKAKPVTEGQKTLDRDFAKEYSDYVAAGGSSQINKILADLKTVEDLLESNKTITGIKVSVADATGTLSALYPDAATAKDLAGGVIQSNLRAILGGQFAQKEGEALLARAYNPAQPQKDNLERIRNLRKQIETAASAKKRAVDYWEENEGTLAGFKGDLGKVKPAKTSSKGIPEGVDPAVWNVMTPEEKALWQ